MTRVYIPKVEFTILLSIECSGRVAEGGNMKRKALLLVSCLLLTSCGISFNGSSSRSSINADIILLDISGSSINSADTYNSEDHSPSSLASRQIQIRNKLVRAISENTAIYFGFVKNKFGAQELYSLVPSRLLLDIDSFISNDMYNDVRRRDTKEGIVVIWQKLLLSSNPISPSCAKDISTELVNKSLGKLTPSHASTLGSQLCVSAESVQEVLVQLKVEPENIGSDIQGAIDRSLDKISSDERRLYSPEGKQILLNPRIILVSDLIQKLDSGFLPQLLAPLTKIEEACTLATESALSHRMSYQGSPSLISDGFGGTKKSTSEVERDKLKEYWTCWFKTRGITEIDLGARGIDLGNL